MMQNHSVSDTADFSKTQIIGVTYNKRGKEKWSKFNIALYFTIY